MVGALLFHAALAFVFFHDHIGVRMHLEVEIYRVLVDRVLWGVISLQEWSLFDIIGPVLDAVVPPL